MEIRKLMPTDDPAEVGALVRDAYAFLPDYPVGDDDYLATINDIAGRSAETDVVVGVLDGRVVACLTFIDGHENSHAEFDDVDAASFRYFGVASTVQGRGVGEAMVRWCADEARRLGRRRLRIHTLTMMYSAQRLYERVGFVREPERDASWDGIVGLAYRLDL